MKITVKKYDEASGKMIDAVVDDSESETLDPDGTSFGLMMRGGMVHMDTADGVRPTAAQVEFMKQQRRRKDGDG